MNEHSASPYDIMVVGAGFAGSLTALVLHQLGFRVCVLERESHPRFAIGESSTPIADMILRELAAKYKLSWLQDFSRYGSWQATHPEIVCGLKRGFSFFKHSPGRDFATDTRHNHELLVAASTDNLQSDTNWLRADFDAFLAGKLKESGIPYYERTGIIRATYTHHWEMHTDSEKNPVFYATFLVDATGSGKLLEKIAGVASSSRDFLTDSFAVYSHFDHIRRWTDLLHEKGISTADFPYDPDDSALHHLLEEGWVWQLRFNDQRTSMGFVLSGANAPPEDLTAEELWDLLPQRYPAIREILRTASLCPVPGKIIRSPRLQRKTECCYGPGWVALPATAGFVDPLFSTGIAHTLAGIKKLSTIFSKYRDQPGSLEQDLAGYERSVFEELRLIDQLVAGSYQTFAAFGLFNSWSMLYFAATIHYEQGLLRGEDPGYFLGAGNRDIRKIVDDSFVELTDILRKGHPTGDTIRWFAGQIRKRIAPFNTAGLLDPASRNMYRHTAAVL